MEHRLRISPAVGFAAALALTSMPWASSASAATTSAAQIEASRASGLAWLYKNQKGDGSWSQGTGEKLKTQSTSAVLLAMARSGINHGTSFNSGVASLANSQPASTDALSRQIDALYIAGLDVSALSSQLTRRATAKAGSWGALPGYSSSIIDTALATSTSMSVMVGYKGWADIACQILGPQQASDGGWTHSGGVSYGQAGNSAVLPTVYAILLLQKIAAQGNDKPCTSGANYVISTMLGNAVKFLKTKIHSDGGVADDAASESGILETALFYVAVQTVLGNDASLTSAQNFLISNQLSDGSWAHDPFQTALVLQTFPATTLAISAGDGVPDVVKSQLNLSATNPVRSLGSQPGNGQSIAGASRPLISISAMLNQAISYTVVSKSGAAPFQYALSTGAFPPGLGLSTSGVISGTPAAQGVYNTVLQVTDAGANVTYAVVQIVVDADSADTPTLPEWAFILTGLLLLVTIGYRQNKKFM